MKFKKNINYRIDFQINKIQKSIMVKLFEKLFG
jgi:hypothetical protein